MSEEKTNPLSSSTTLRNLPFLPGYRIDLDKRDRFHKTHRFDISNGVRVDLERPPIEQVVRANEKSHPLQISSGEKSFEEEQEARFTHLPSTMSRLPAWVAYDRKVLRFYGYFKESVHSSQLENFRIRKCVVYYYLEDDSIHIAEPKIENSGIPQGVFIKRHRIPKSDSSFYSVDDLYIGAELPVYGRVFRLTDCDAFTREFYKANGSELQTAERFPLDSFTKKNTYHPHTHHKLMNPLKTFMEATLGKPNIDIDSTQKFLVNDGKVLRFYVRWDDEKLLGEKRPYILHYFLADDTVEILEVQQPNSGRDPFPALLKRQKLPKEIQQWGPDLSRIGGENNDPKINYYTEADFRVGNTINVYGRQLFLCGADKFTIEYYISNYGLNPSDFPRIGMSESDEMLARIDPPPYNGFGSEEDSLGSFLYLMPKVPKQDFKKLMENDGVLIRFLAQFINPSKVDKQRRFIVTYYLANDTMSIFEKFERNSGFIGGKFLERDRVKNPDSAEYYKATDLYVGAVLSVNKYLFQLVDCDEYTRKFIENNKHIWKNIPTQPTKANLPDVAAPSSPLQQTGVQVSSNTMMAQ